MCVVVLVCVCVCACACVCLCLCVRACACVCVCVLVCMRVYHQDICVHMERRGNLLDICFSCPEATEV